MRIDLHVHAKERSACGHVSEEGQIRVAIDTGLDALVFTDHHKLVPLERLAELNEAYAPFRVFGGIELSVDGEDILVLGINDSRLVTEKWSYPELHMFCRESGGFLALAHPFRVHPDIKIDLEKYPPDAIEVYSVHTPPEAADRIFALAARFGLQTLSNSDAHITDPIGKYCNVLNRVPVDERELIDILRKGEFARISPQA